LKEKNKLKPQRQREEPEKQKVLLNKFCQVQQQNRLEELLLEKLLEEYLVF